MPNLLAGAALSFAAPQSSETSSSKTPSSEILGPRWRGHIPALDGVRGLAVLLVLFYHATIDISVVRSDPWWAIALHGVWRNFGWCGVDLFFVLSGFLITGILVDAKGRPHFLRNFYARRVLRIFPLYYAYLFAVMVVGPRVSSEFAGAVRVGDDGWAYWLYLQNYITAWHGDWPHGQLFDHLWSLAIEEQFYLVWPFVVLLCSRQVLKYVAISLVFVSLGLRLMLDAQGVSPVALYVLTFTRLDGLALGAWIALRVRQQDDEMPNAEVGMRNAEVGMRNAEFGMRNENFPLSRGEGQGEGGPPLRAALSQPLPKGEGPSKYSQSLQPLVPLLVSALGIAGLFVWQGTFAYYAPAVRTVGLSLVAVLFACLLMLILNRPGSRLERSFSSAFLRMLGRFSYALYVLHFPVIKFTNSAIYRLLPERSDLEHQLLLYGVALPVSLGLALASWYLLESPILRLKRRFR